ncbi:MAG: glycosyltransferase family 9 protein [Phycisphaerales bacterium]
MPDPSKILIIRPSALGDVCRSVPVLASLRRAYPEARIDWLVQDTFVDAVWYHPGLTNVVPFPRNGLAADLRRGRIDRVLGWMNRTLRGPGYDLVLDCQGLGRSGLFARWTGARVRIGYARPEGRELSWLGVNRRVRVPPSDGPSPLHAVDRMLELVRAAGVEPVRDMRLYTGPKERAFVQKRLDGRRYAVIAPTSRWPGKRWPADRFAAVAEALLERGTVEAVAVVGGKNERDQCGPLLELASRGGEATQHAALSTQHRILDLVGATSVGELMAVVKSAAVVIANDSAALHMAVGFDRPSVGLFGPTRVELVGPYTGHAPPPSARTAVIQHLREGDRMDHKDERGGREMMERIGAEKVIAAAESAGSADRNCSR